MKNESALRLKIRTWDEYVDGFVSFVEPSIGSDVGISDCLFTIKSKLVPVELKRGRSVLRELRPSQRMWHRTQLHNGIKTYGLLLLRDDSVELYRLSLSGGFASDFIETLLLETDLESMSFKRIASCITADNTP